MPKPAALVSFDQHAIALLNRISLPLARLALFAVYFWFGILKVVAESPANPLVAQLLERTLPFVTFDQFIVALGFYEMLIGVVFLLPRWERVAVALLIPHLFMTAGPLVLLPEVAWQSFLVPTLEGQYMIKNILIISLAFVIASRLTPWERKPTKR
jgi:uncharacterized membrane protein YkgB